MSNPKYPAIVIFAYNRIKPIKILVKTLNKLKPRKLYLILDGPKNSLEIDLINSVLKYFQSNILVEKVLYRVSQTNVGLRANIVAGLDWVFSKEESAIILEDDCIPDQSYFRFCEELLEKYKDNKKILSIAGFNAYPDNNQHTSYSYSKYVESWGWATWRRAWQLYDDKMSDWPELRRTDWLNRVTNNKLEAIYWKYIFDLTYQGKFDSWAYRWMYSSFYHQALTIVPKGNLIHNIGFGRSATNTKIRVNLPPIQTMKFPLTHPKDLLINNKRDAFYAQAMYKNPVAIGGLIKKYFLG